MLDANNNPIFQTTPQSGTDYNALKQNNPYAQSLRKKTWLDGLVSSLGLQSGYDKYELERKQNELNYEASINQLIQQNAYNSPTEQADRMREAGMNPDLVDGVSDNTQSSEAAPPLALSDMSDVISKANEPVQKLGQNLIQAIQFAFGIAESINGIEGMKLSNDSKDISNLLSLFRGADEMESKFTQPLRLDEDGNPILALDVFPYNLEHPFKNNRYNKQWEFWRTRIQKGLPYRNKRYSDIVATGKSWIPALGWSPMYDRDNSDYVSPAFKAFTDALKTFDGEIYSNTLYAQKLMSKYNLDYSNWYSNNGESVAKMDWRKKIAEDVENKNLIATRTFSKRIFDQLSKNDDLFSQLVLFSMAVTSLGNGFDPVNWGADLLGDTVGNVTNFIPKFFGKKSGGININNFPKK